MLPYTEPPRELVSASFSHTPPSPLNKGNLMKNKLTAVIAIGALTLAACGGVDRGGTRDKFISDIEEIGGTADGDCIDEVFKDYSDDEIEALSEGSDDARSVALATDLVACTDLGG
jgi:hypothetical protein